MNSNKFFSPDRFYLLLRNDLMLNYKKYLLTILGAFIVVFVILYWNMPKAEFRGNFDGIRYMQSFMMCLFGLGAFVGLAFPELGNKITTSNYLLLPSSVFEKYLVQFIIRAVAGSFLFLIIFWIDTHLARFAALRAFEGQYNVHTIENFHLSMIFGGEQNTIIKSAIVFACFSIGMFLFAVRIFFKRFALVKTVITIVAAFYLFASMMVTFSHIFYPENIDFELKIDRYEIFHGLNNLDLWFFSVFYLSWLFILPLGYFKLKEKQV